MQQLDILPIRNNQTKQQPLDDCDFFIDCQAALNVLQKRLATLHWQLHHCRRDGKETLHFFVTDENAKVLTPTRNRARVGLTLAELLIWLEK